MAGFSIIEDFRVKSNPAFLEKAAALEPKLTKRQTAPVDALPKTVLHKGDRVRCDFGGHQVGYVSFDLIPVGSHFDAPVWLRIRLAEIPSELEEDLAGYTGWLSSSWVQQETVHMDELPCTVRLPRRYAFRYMQVEVLDTSPKYGVQIRNVSCETVTSAGAAPAPLDSGDPLLDRIDQTAIVTLRECMQSVFEDGPKRDRRLWLGDLRLAALANYATFRNNDLVKRCLYLFAGTTFADGRLGACLFHRPEPQVDDTYLMDFALLFCTALWEYFEASSDRDTLAELYPAAMEQIDLCLNTMLDENHVVVDHGDDFWCFIDWGAGLNKQCSAQGVLICAIGYGARMAKAMGDPMREHRLAEQAGILREAAREAFWDEDQALFVSSGQISWASQIWMVLAGVTDRREGGALLRRLPELTDGVGVATPYLFHYYIEALLCCWERDAALSALKAYWGGMLDHGADTFWEVYDPKDPHRSPYGSTMVNSYCHAWGCTPAWFLRRIFKRK